jgi:hypothetical protein
MSDEGNSDIGPHEDRELELMLAGRKPLAMFTEVVSIESDVFPEADFEPYVRSGRIIKREVFEQMDGPPTGPKQVVLRRVLYALPEEKWRIDAILLACRVEASLQRWDEGVERIIGLLLGYEDHQIDAFVKRVL